MRGRHSTRGRVGVIAGTRAAHWRSQAPHPLAGVRHARDLGEQAVHLRGRGAQVHLRVHQAGGPHHLLHHGATRRGETVETRRRRRRGAVDLAEQLVAGVVERPCRLQAGLRGGGVVEDLEAPSRRKPAAMAARCSAPADPSPKHRVCGFQRRAPITAFFPSFRRATPPRCWRSSLPPRCRSRQRMVRPYRFAAHRGLRIGIDLLRAAFTSSFDSV